MPKPKIQPKKTPKPKADEPSNSDVENNKVINTAAVRRKSSRLSGKVQQVKRHQVLFIYYHDLFIQKFKSWRNADNGNNSDDDEDFKGDDDLNEEDSDFSCDEEPTRKRKKGIVAEKIYN